MLNEYKIEEYTSKIIDNFKYSNKKELVIVCIGTDKCIGDSVAPMVGTFIEEKNSNIVIYGTLEKPMHALNLEDRLEDIQEKHPNAYIIGIDACLGDEESVILQLKEDFSNIVLCEDANVWDLNREQFIEILEKL